MWIRVFISGLAWRVYVGSRYDISAAKCGGHIKFVECV
jgi:hypothetical protein